MTKPILLDINPLLIPSPFTNGGHNRVRRGACYQMRYQLSYRGLYFSSHRYTANGIRLVLRKSV